MNSSPFGERLQHRQNVAVSDRVPPDVTESIPAAYSSDESLALREARLRSLMIQALAGDEASYRALLTELSSSLRAFYRRRLGGLAAEVEDLVQETLLAIHNQRHTYDPARPLTAWCFAIAKYKLIDMLRRRGRGDALTDPLDDESWLAAADLEAGMAARDLARVLAELPDRHRLPIVHMKLEGRSVAETARLTGMSEAAVKVGVHRGLKALAAKFSGVAK
jgi:RNA polymerase sigma factor (sigma-70 family)